jgi:hypothetical protein
MCYQGQTCGSITVSSEESDDDAGDGGRNDVVPVGCSTEVTSAFLVPSGSQDGSCAAPAGP